MLDTGKGLNVGISVDVFPIPIISFVFVFNGVTAKQ